MAINKLNYQKYLIDYIDGNLPNEEHEIFGRLLENHPKINNEISDYLSAPRMPYEQHVYEHKTTLYKSQSLKLLVWILFLVLLISIAASLLIRENRKRPQTSFAERNNVIHQGVKSEPRIYTFATLMDQQDFDCEDFLYHSSTRENIIDSKKAKSKFKNRKMKDELLNCFVQKPFRTKQSVAFKIKNIPLRKKTQVLQNSGSISFGKSEQKKHPETFDSKISYKSYKRESVKMEALPTIKLGSRRIEEDVPYHACLNLPRIEVETDWVVDVKKTSKLLRFIKHRMIPEAYQVNESIEALVSINTSVHEPALYKNVKEHLIPNIYSNK